MEIKYFKNTFLRNKLTNEVIKLKQDVVKIDEKVYESWEIKEGEYCWLKFDLKLIKITKINKYSDVEYPLYSYYDKEKGRELTTHPKMVEPFIGELPSRADC